MKKKVCVIYVRVSTIEQDYTRQINDLRRYVEQQKDLQLDKEHPIFEEKISGKIEKRDVFEEMKRYVFENKIQQIIAWEMSRFGRSTVAVLNNINEFKKRGVGVYFYKQQIDTLTTDATKKAVINFLATFSEIESEQIKMRTVSGRENAIAMGGTAGYPILPYGYKRKITHSGKKTIKTLEINPEEEKYVRMMFTLKPKMGLRQLIRFLNTHEPPIPTRKGKISGWGTNNVTKILKNKIYIGIREWSVKADYQTDPDKIERVTKIFEVPHLRIISDKLWKAVQNSFTDEVTKQQQGKLIRTLKNEYLLRGMLTCGCCGWKLGGRTEERTGRSKNQFYYCHGRKHNRNCDIGQINKEMLQSLVMTVFEMKTEVINKLVAEGIAKNDLDTLKREEYYLNEEVKKIDEEQERINFLFQKGKKSEEQWESETEKLDDKKKPIEKELKSVRQKMLLFKESENNARSMLSHRLFKLDIRKALEQGVEYINVHKVEHLDFVWTDLDHRLYDRRDFGNKKNRPLWKNDKIIFCEIKLIELQEPLKLVFSTLSRGSYAGNDLLFDSKIRKLSLARPRRNKEAASLKI